MTVYESFHNKSIDELAEWMNKNIVDDSPWVFWWDNKYCNKCDGVSFEGQEYGLCELHNKCKFFQDMDGIPDNKQIIKMWLEREI